MIIMHDSINASFILCCLLNDRIFIMDDMGDALITSKCM